MRFIFSWTGSYLKAALAAAVVLAGATMLVVFLKGGEVTASAFALAVASIFAGVAISALIPALIVSAMPEMVGIGPSGFFHSIVGAGLALAALAGLSLAEVQEARLLDRDRAEAAAWVLERFDGVPLPQLGAFGCAGAAAGGALARSRRRAMNKAAG